MREYILKRGEQVKIKSKKHLIDLYNFCGGKTRASLNTEIELFNSEDEPYHYWQRSFESGNHLVYCRERDYKIIPDPLQKDNRLEERIKKLEDVVFSKEEKEWEVNRLYKSRNTGLIVFCTSETDSTAFTGIAVNSVDSNKRGDTSKQWGKEFFEPYDLEL